MASTINEQKLSDIKRNSVNHFIILTRSIFLRSMAFIYLTAFVSLYFQIQGLWGEEGLLPAGNLLKKLSENYKEKSKFYNFPALLWFSEEINTLFLKIMNLINLESTFSNTSHIDNTLYLLCLLGIIISLCICLKLSLFFNPFGFFILWIIYLNFYIIGQVFMNYQWDVLLLETGFITIFICPMTKFKLNIISPIENLTFNMLRFLMFRFMYSNGIVKIISECPTWLSFTALHYHFQSQPIPNYMSYYAHFLQDGVKRILVAMTYLIEIYVPFLFFLCYRRFNIFAGVLNVGFQLSIILTGNYNFFNFLTLTINMSLFDDEFIRAFIPSFVLNIFDLDPLSELGKYVEEKKENQETDDDDTEITNIEDKENDTENKENNIINSTNEGEEEKNKQINPLKNENNNNNNKEDIISEKVKLEKEAKIREILKNKKLRKIYEQFEDVTEKFPDKLFNKSSILSEGFIFINFFTVTLMFTFFYLFPLKDLLQSSLKINPQDLKFLIYNKFFLNFYMIYILAYLIIIFGLDMIKIVKYKLLSGSVFSCLAQLINCFLFLTVFVLYFLNSVNVFYSSIDLKLVDREKDKSSLIGQGIDISDYLFLRLRVNHGYGLFRKITGLSGRPELEIKILNIESDKWETVNFTYKMSDSDGFNLKMNIPHQPRVDWQMWFAALSNDYNTEPWLVLMLGKILERNPVTLDLLGYHIKEKENYFKNSFAHQFFNTYLNNERQVLNYTPKKIKIDLYNYHFNTKFADVGKGKGKFWTKKFSKNFLPAIEKNHLKEIITMYGLPSIDDTRKVAISPFQFVPVIDIIALSILIFIALRLF